LVRGKHPSALTLPLGVGLGVVVASKVLGVSLLWSAALLALTNAAIVGVRFRQNYLHEGLS